MNNITRIRRFAAGILPRQVFRLEIARHYGHIFRFRPFSTGNLPTLTMFTKDQCSLCDDARVVLEEYKHRYNFEEVYITDKGNEEWYMKYKYEIPVFHLDGKFLMKHRVDRKLLEEKLPQCDKK